jgi:hypothetical protein
MAWLPTCKTEASLLLTELQVVGRVFRYRLTTSSTERLTFGSEALAFLLPKMLGLTQQTDLLE